MYVYAPVHAYAPVLSEIRLGLEVTQTAQISCCALQTFIKRYRVFSSYEIGKLKTKLYLTNPIIA